MIPVYRLINKLANKQRREFEKMTFSGEQYSPAQSRFLHHLFNHRNQEICQKDLEEEFGLRAPSATAVVQSLVQSGLIIRIPSEKDARIKYLHLTDKAMAYEQEITQCMDALETKIIGGISEDDLAAWERVTLQLMKNLDA